MIVLEISEPYFHGNEWRYVKECLDTGWVSSGGPFVTKFERAVADYVGAPYAVATVNGTAALHIALLVAGVKPGDDVLVPDFTFVASANAVRYCGANPVFLDVTEDTGNLDPEAVETFLREAYKFNDGRLIHCRTGRRMAAILPVHLYGHPADMRALGEVAARYQLAIVEDGAESLGAWARGQRLGALSDIICFSFNGNKVITTGGGGMIVTRHQAFAERARHLTTQARADSVEYQHDAVGFNYRMPNLNAALGLAQIEQLDGFLKRKRTIAELYQRELGAIEGLRVSGEAPWATSSYWLINIFLDQRRTELSARNLRSYLVQKGIGSRPLWYPLHRQAAYADREAYRITVADRLWEQGLSLPSSPGLSLDQVEKVCQLIRKALN